MANEYKKQTKSTPKFVIIHWLSVIHFSFRIHQEYLILVIQNDQHKKTMDHQKGILL